MSSSDPAAPQPSLVRTGAKAGLSFAGSVIKGALLGVFLGGGVFFFYLSQLQGPGNVAARAGGVGAALALITSPPMYKTWSLGVRASSTRRRMKAIESASVSLVIVLKAGESFW